jgi:hypothetical protein
MRILEVVLTAVTGSGGRYSAPVCSQLLDMGVLHVVHGLLAAEEGVSSGDSGSFSSTHDPTGSPVSRRCVFTRRKGE